ncbi:TRAP transporter small permease [Lutimaribacter sp. EGI FJ00015]|uniref:TRAP transporter small permease n=1 Tax=Lutimaribacter degradans TaxID=2945989 RepID=A0ACC5ZUS7_9RHOB|nr:TRAP transporter small permease [Lutimaribacter sp. EGI FJ00013]MCM2562087.1 TRAP transporter small permease [Lutimaribacter sp. EGI FJ00013]MCO0613240.1 TRAP transporter small permease [Lutimaribacter sp. EGI FJ00015]MCO0636217.1 TRAP transporter small permease [Lutimaribacter sp. EGI FJ00014]
MKYFLKLEAITTGIALRAAIVFLLIATCLALYQVTTRFVFGQPSTWSEVITRSAMIWSVFLAVAPAFREGAMIAVEIVQRMLPPRLGFGLYLVSMGLSLTFFAILFWQGWAMTERVVSQKLAALEISIAWVYSALPVGSVFILIAILGCIVRAIQHGAIVTPETVE